mgnify:CR=1 FL=1
MNVYTNRPVNRISRRARAAERRVTLAAVLLTFSVIVTLATVRRIIDERQGSNLSEAAALAYAAVMPAESTAESSAADDDSTDDDTVYDNIVVTDIIA